jgi:serine phosphatase RsbU (regulator of sigma subunit)
MRFSVRNKLNTIVIVIVLLFSPILFYYFPLKQNENLRSSFEDEVHSIARTVALGVNIALQEHNFEGIETAMKYAKTDKRMAFVAMVQRDTTGNKIVTNLFPEDYAFTTDIQSSDKIIVKRDSITSDLFNGEVVLGFTTTSIKEKIKQSRYAIFLFSGIVSVLSILFGLLISTFITRPINRLIEGTSKISEGDLSIRINNKSKDEIGALTNSFNKMVEQIQTDTVLLQEQTKLLNYNNKQITDSINYSKRIQNVLLASNKELFELFPKSFIYFKPKDIVSGDFLWLCKKDEYVYVAAVDCTGHGVPGAMMSIIGHFILEKINSTGELILPGEILDQLNDNIKLSLKQETHDAPDGMDVALCRINTKTNEVIFSGAHRGLYHYTSPTEVTEVKGSRKGIGGKINKQTPFENNELQLSKNDWLIFYTDGLPDQFGKNNKKFGHQNIKNVILDNFDKKGFEIEMAMNSRLQEYRDGTEQIDDILLIGIKI